MKDRAELHESQNDESKGPEEQSAVKRRKLEDSDEELSLNIAKSHNLSKKTGDEKTRNPEGNVDQKERNEPTTVWRKRDDKILKKAIAKYHKLGFSRIAEEVPGKTKMECSARYKELQKRSQEKERKKAFNSLLKGPNQTHGAKKRVIRKKGAIEENKVSNQNSAKSVQVKKSGESDPKNDKKDLEPSENQKSKRVVPPPSGCFSSMKKAVIRNKKKEKPPKVKKAPVKKPKRKKVSKRDERNSKIKKELDEMELASSTKKADGEETKKEPSPKGSKTLDADLNSLLDKTLTEKRIPEIKEESLDFNPAVKLANKQKPEEESKHPSLETLFNKNTLENKKNDEKRSESSQGSGKLPSLNQVVDTQNIDKKKSEKQKPRQSISDDSK